MPRTKGAKSDNPGSGIKQGTHHGVRPPAAADDDSDNLTDSQSAPTLPVAKHDNGAIRSCQSEGDRSHDQKIDYQSLAEALTQSNSSSSNDLDYDPHLGDVSSSSEFDDEMPESIELTHQVGSETLMEMLGGERDLEQQMKAIEEQESTTLDEPLTPPALIRVVYMGTASDTDRRLFFQKLSEGLSRILDKDPLAERASGMFRERKHHLLYLKREADEQQHVTCQDYGVSIIEADFSRRRGELTDHPLFMRYIWQQCESAREDHPGLWKDLTSHHSDYFCYPEKTPNGIDLCVYFYDGDHAQDLAVLQCFKKLGVPILPILSMYTRPAPPTLGVIADRRNQLADWLARYRIRCLDISLLSFLEFGQRPSFGLQKTPFPLASVASLSTSSRRARGEWEAAGMTTPAPYQILTIDQFVAMDRHAIFSILERSRQRAIQREALRGQIRKEMEKNSDAAATSTTSSASASASSSCGAPPRKAYIPLPVWMSPPRSLLILVLMTLLLPVYQYYSLSTYDASLTLITTTNTKNVSFTVKLQDDRGHPQWYPHGPFVVLVNDAPHNITILQLEALGTYQFTLPAPACSPSGADPPSFMKVDLRSSVARAVLRTKPAMVRVPPCSSPSTHESQPTHAPQSWMGVVRCIYENSGEIARFMWNGDDITP